MLGLGALFPGEVEQESPHGPSGYLVLHPNLRTHY